MIVIMIHSKRVEHQMIEPARERTITIVYTLKGCKIGHWGLCVIEHPGNLFATLA